MQHMYIPGLIIITWQLKNEVSIVEGASDLGDKAYRPSLIKIKVGDSITWTNNDSITPHTVTEGNPANNLPISGFDSGLLSQGQTFKHKFDKAGATEYFCTFTSHNDREGCCKFVEQNILR